MDGLKANIEVKVEVKLSSNKTCGVCRFHQPSYPTLSTQHRCLLFNKPCKKVRIDNKIRPFGRCNECLRVFGGPGDNG